MVIFTSSESTNEFPGKFEASTAKLSLFFAIFEERIGIGWRSMICEDYNKINVSANVRKLWTLPPQPRASAAIAVKFLNLREKR
jgi:hypothetical protein